MSDAATAQKIVSLDEYRRARGISGSQHLMPAAIARQTAPVTPMATAASIYWVPVWVW
jgi:hypothetical protein